MNTLFFLKKKIKNISFISFVINESFQLIFFIPNLIPGIIGIFLRGIVLKVFLKSSKGLPFSQPNIIIQYPQLLSVGKNFGCNCGTYINAIGGIYIGDNVLLSTNVVISSGYHSIKNKFPPIYERTTKLKNIIIEDDVWIGSNSTILPGIKLGTGSVIGANTLVIKNTDKYKIYSGVPAKIINER